MHESELSEQTAVRRREASPRRDEGDGPALDLPSQMGNRAFTRHVAAPVQRAGERSQGAGPLDPEIEADIRAAQGGGRALDDGVRGELEPQLGVDLSTVRVHADSRADALSRSVRADAFTTGTDVFFRSGRYAPDTGDGRRLLAHELTHVVQQASGAVPAESRVSHPEDRHEKEAASVATTLSSLPTDSQGQSVQRQETAEEELPEEDESGAVSREAMTEEPEEEEAVNSSAP